MAVLGSWRRLYREAHDLEPKREVVRQRTLAAGGRIDDHGIVLPLGLRRCLSLAELKTQAMIAELKLVERAMGCAWCPNNSAIPGDALCEHCRWLAGAQP